MLAIARKKNRPQHVIAALTDKPATYISNFLVSNGASRFSADQNAFGQVSQEYTGNKVKSFLYRADGKISWFQTGGLSVSYYYDGLDRLVAKAIDDGSTYTQSFTHVTDENRVLLGKAGNGSVTTYIIGLEIDEYLGEVKGGVGKSYITDHLGSVLNSSPAGSSKVYGLSGEPSATPAISATAPPKEFSYAGYAYERESGLYETQNRKYNPLVGRWNRQDPLGYFSGDGSNYYQYVRNNPLLYTDPTGLYCSRKVARGGLVIVGGIALGVISPQLGAACGGVGIGMVIGGAFDDCDPAPPPPSPPPVKAPPKESNPPSSIPRQPLG